MDITTKILNGLEELYSDKPFIANLKRTAAQYDLDYDFMSLGQLKSKTWLLDELQNTNIDFTMVYLMGGWYAHLASMMFERFENEYYHIRSFDIDPLSTEIANKLNRSWVIDAWRFKAITKDMFNINFTNHDYYAIRNDKSFCKLSEVPDLVINTSGEHVDLTKWWKNIPEGLTCIVQSNNYFEGNGHINCVNNEDELMDQIPMMNVLFKGTLHLEDYDRYMIIGQK